VGIVPWNPRRVLNPTGVKSETKKTRRSSLVIPATPRKARASRSTTKQALDILKPQMTFEEVQLVKQLIRQMDKGLQQSIADKEIGEHIH
jgi:hypothetical protein